jgi:hypothetical protein
MKARVAIKVELGAVSSAVVDLSGSPFALRSLWVFYFIMECEGSVYCSCMVLTLKIMCCCLWISFTSGLSCWQKTELQWR